VRKTTVLVAVLLVLAGCGGQSGVTTPDTPQTTTAEPTTEAPATTTASSESVERVEVTERGATLGDVNATKVWLRVGELVRPALPESPPPVVVREGGETVQVEPTAFRQSLGATNYTSSTRPSGRYLPNGTVVIYRDAETTDREVESTLAHEFAHVVQFNRLGGFPNSETLAVQTVLEGAAELVEWQYADRYGASNGRLMYSEYFSRFRPVSKIGSAPYYFGAQWVRNHSDGAPLAGVFHDRPTTAEQVLHGLAPGSEPPRNLTVAGESGEYGIFAPSSPTRKGEARLRFLLEYGLTPERAARAAAGWGNDRLLEFQSTAGDGWAWVVRWDAASEAREFEHLFADYRANVSEPVRLATVGDETTVLFSGRGAFVGNATASGTAGNVTVAAGH
jgi:hypothetical protein